MSPPNDLPKRTLVSICRKGLDPNKIQGFVLASSAQFLVLQYVYDFNLDGLMVLNRAAISEVRETATDKFQTGLLKRDGLFDQVPFAMEFDFKDWRSIINQFSGAYPLIILECEGRSGPAFTIGRVLKTTPTAAHVRHFTGAGRWLKNLVRVAYDDITSCQVGTNYQNAYQRHFERNAR